MAHVYANFNHNLTPAAKGLQGIVSIYIGWHLSCGVETDLLTVHVTLDPGQWPAPIHFEQAAKTCANY